MVSWTRFCGSSRSRSSRRTPGGDGLQGGRACAPGIMALSLIWLSVGCGGSKPETQAGGQQCAKPGLQGPVISAFLTSPRNGPAGVALRLAKLGAEVFDLAGSSLTDELGTRGEVIRERGDGGRRDLVFPKGIEATRLAPRQEIWVARDAAAFATQFGFSPDFEVGEDARFPANDPKVPDLRYIGPKTKKGPWLSMRQRGASILALMGSDEEVCPLPFDVVPYNFTRASKATPKRPKQNKLRILEQKAGLPEGALWRGEPLMSAGNLFLPSPPFSRYNRIYARNRDEKGLLMRDTNTAKDWDAGSSRVGLGQARVHRVWAPGQSSFVSQRHDEQAIVTMTASPDSNFAATVRAFGEAKKDIKVHIYYFSSVEIAESLVAAIKRGVDVSLAMEGGVVGVRHGFSDKEREIARRIEEAGRERSKKAGWGLGRVYWLRSDGKAKIDDRYSYDHSKYAIIDGRWIIIGSENYGSTGHSLSNTHGNRGWEIQIRTPAGAPVLGVVRDLIAVWKADVDPKVHRDYVRYTDHPTTLDREGRGRYGPPARGMKLKSSLRYGRYVPREPPEETITAKIGAELVVSPDTSLNEHGAILGAIAKAKHTLLLEHLSFAKYWGGKRMGSLKGTPNVLLQACIAAARRGVKVRILLSCRGFACDRPDAKWESGTTDNDDVYSYVNALAAKEHLDIEARLLDTTSDDWLDDPEAHGLDKIHNKGMVVDGHVTLCASINGVENSFKANREVGVLVDSPEVARFYEELFWYDWTTVMSPQGLELLPKPGRRALKALRKSVTHTGILLKGLKPSTRYYLRVSTFDSDTTDVENTNPPKPLSPHHSALSAQVQGVSSNKGALLLQWKRNRSECLEGDLAGYEVYYSDAPGVSATGGLLLPEDVKKLKIFEGRGAKNGPSPVRISADKAQRQCRAIRATQAKREPKPDPVCSQLLTHVGACLGKSGEAFSLLDTTLQRHGPVGSARWQRRKDTLVRACTAPEKGSERTWNREREECGELVDCVALFSCLKRAERWKYRQLLQDAPPPKKKKKKRHRRKWGHSRSQRATHR